MFDNLSLNYIDKYRDLDHSYVCATNIVLVETSFA
jgi:hypothetical protein